uniref:Uncharacterized protein n=1 Tax=Strongyloides stercoralis TaxID=6248 RepID=A0A0K0E9Z7_STRER
MTSISKKVFFNFIAIVLVIQILQFTVETDAYIFQRPIYFFNKKTKMNLNDALHEETNKNSFHNGILNTKYMFKRMTPCYYSPIQCLVK